MNHFYNESLTQTINAMRKFYSYFIKNVKLMRIRTQSVARALKIFETINDRGKGLDSMDLLKNLMFMQATQEEFEKFKPEIANEHVQKLGNLTLAEDAINTSLGNKPYSEKRVVYTNSKFLLTKSISAKVKVGTKTAIDRAVSDLESFDTWTTTSIAERQASLTKLAFSVWEILPASSQTI